MQNTLNSTKRGRKPHVNPEPRVAFYAFISKTTKAKIKKMAKKERLSEGKTLDAVFAELPAKKGGVK